MSLTTLQGRALIRLADALEVLAAQAALPHAQKEVQRWTPGGYDWDAPEPSEEDVRRLNEAEAHEEALLATIRGFRP